MWLAAVSVPLVVMVTRRYGLRVAALCRRALARLLRLLRGRVCVRSTHAFVFSRCTHGQVDSVLETFDLYADSHPTLCISPQTGQGALHSPIMTGYVSVPDLYWDHLPARMCTWLKGLVTSLFTFMAQLSGKSRDCDLFGLSLTGRNVRKGEINKPSNCYCSAQMWDHWSFQTGLNLTSLCFYRNSGLSHWLRFSSAAGR